MHRQLPKCDFAVIVGRAVGKTLAARRIISLAFDCTDLMQAMFTGGNAQFVRKAWTHGLLTDRDVEMWTQGGGTLAPDYRHFVTIEAHLVPVTFTGDTKEESGGNANERLDRNA
jgi:hypothetical protein